MYYFVWKNLLTENIVLFGTSPNCFLWTFFLIHKKVCGLRTKVWRYDEHRDILWKKPQPLRKVGVFLWSTEAMHRRMDLVLFLFPIMLSLYLSCPELIAKHSIISWDSIDLTSDLQKTLIFEVAFIPKDHTKSKWPDEVVILTKISTIFWRISALASKKRSNKKMSIIKYFLNNWKK